MKHILPMKVNPAKPKVRACVLWCSDSRFARLYNAFVRREFGNPLFVFPVKVAGGMKELNNAAQPAWRDYILYQLDVAIALGAKRIYSANHIDCKAYNHVQELSFYLDEHANAENVIKQHLKTQHPDQDFAIVKLIGMFDGLHRI